MELYMREFKEFRTRVMCRKKAVEEMIHEWNAIGCGECKEHPDAPCCLLRTENELLAKYIDILDRELFHLENKNDEKETTDETT